MWYLAICWVKSQEEASETFGRKVCCPLAHLDALTCPSSSALVEFKAALPGHTGALNEEVVAR